ncbi:MAG: sulfatase-like hydrolase/transferase [bacterium]|nr:sulfatase-like hydrolase/transferase [bacterium]
MKKIIIILAMIVIAGAAAFLFLVKPGPPDYIFLLTLDTTRADHIDYTPGNPTTPNLAQLAAEGVAFDNAYCLIPITLPSHANMFYSQPPYKLKLYNNQQARDIPEKSVAELVKEKGFKTGAVISLGVMEKHFHMHKGFDNYVENFPKGLWYKTGDLVNKDAFEMIDTKTPGKAFYWLHYSDPHNPYFSPEYSDGVFKIQLNSKEIYRCRSVDQLMVRLDLELEPGRNVLRMKTLPPRKVLNTKNIKIDFLSLMEFTVKSESPAESYKMEFPGEWHEIYSKRLDATHYNTRKRIGKIIINNNNKEKIKMNISFIYKIVESPSSSMYLYKEEICYLDQRIGEFIQYLKDKGIYDRSAFVIIGDHGEGINEHKKLIGHVQYLNKLYTKVPLIISGKGISKQDASLKPVTTLNIAPTILELAGVEKPDVMMGQSLLKPGELKTNRILLETYSPEAFHDGFSLIDFPYQVIYYPEREKEKVEFFNLDDKDDPLGIVDIQNTMKNKKLKADLLNSVLKISKAILKTKEKSGNISEKHKEILKTLGYL